MHLNVFYFPRFLNSLVLNTNRRLKTTLGKTFKPHNTPKPKNHSFLVQKLKKKPNQKLAKSAKPKLPRPLLNVNFLNLACKCSSPADS